MRYLRLFGLLGVFLGLFLLSASNANAQRVTFGIGIGAPVYYGAAPVCTYGYYDYYPYDCAPYGYYGPDWFVSGVFIGAGPWYHRGYGHGYYGRGYARDYYGRGYYGHGYYGRGYYGQGRFDGRDRGFYGRGRNFDRGSRDGDFHGGNGYRGGNFHGGGGGNHGGGNFHGGGSHGEGHGGGRH